MDDSRSGSSVGTALKHAAVLPPFEYQCQLTADQDVEEIGASTIAAGRVRIQRSLCDDDLELMHNSLWYAGRRGNISPLHHQRVLRRDMISTEKVRLHLVWFDTSIYVKRLEDELLNWNYFSEVICGNDLVYQSATGFLLSYARLIVYPSDLDIAIASGLISKNITWRHWQTLRSSLLHHLADRNVHDRFEYGELRLGRLNQIYRMKRLGLAFFTIYREYSSYFGANYMTLVALFALVSVALSAMQVMTTFDRLPAEVSVILYRFSIATLVALAGSCAVLLSLYVGLYVWNWLLILARRAPHRKSSGAC